MRILILLCLIAITLRIHAKEPVAGNYHDNFGYELKLNPDSTFQSDFRFDLEHRWTKGKWKMSNDTIYFDVIPVADTVAHYTLIENVKVPMKSTYGQDTGAMQKLYFGRNKLYRIAENGKLLKKRKRGYSGNKTYNPWYTKDRSIP